ncbi:MAG: PilZ domain-containing protein [Spirochaetes bacterium]|nr:PilZ domain-containing protein [Spirochaetota bacterium]
MGRSIDKRGFFRVKVEKFKVKYRIVNSESDGVEVEVVNVSAGGICFLRDTSLFKGETIEILFPFKTKKIILKAEILRVEGREVGIQFIDEKNKVSDFLDVFNSEYKLIKDYSENKKKIPPLQSGKNISDSEYTDTQRDNDDFDMFKI